MCAPTIFTFPPSLFRTPHMFQRIEWFQLACMPSKCGFTNIIWSHEVPQAVSLSYEPTCHPLEDKKYEFNPPEHPPIQAKALKLRLATILLSQTCVNLRSCICIPVSDTIQPVHWGQSPGFSSFSRLGHPSNPYGKVSKWRIWHFLDVPWQKTPCTSKQKGNRYTIDPFRGDKAV